MFLILKLVLIILSNKTYAHVTQDCEIILLPAWNPTDAKEIPLNLKVFGKMIQLNLRKNDQIVSPAFEVQKYNAKDVTENLSQLKISNSCFYLHEDRVSFAAINFCQGNGLEGLIFVGEVTLEIRPLRIDFAPLSLSNDFCVKEEMNFSFGIPHLIKSSVQYFGDLNLSHWNNFKPKRRRVRSTQQKLNIELAIFFDAEAYRTFKVLHDYDKETIRYMLLVYVNNIQAAFRFPNFSIDISLVHLDIMETQSPSLLVVDNDIEKLLSSFCKYAEVRNPKSDNNPHHWDIGLYLTGLELYKYLGNDTYVVPGISHISGICKANTSCAIVQFHTTSKITSSGLKSSSAAVREIGHILGLSYDSKNQEDKYEYIMAPYGLNQDQMLWSESSRKQMIWLQEFSELYPCLRDYVKPENDAYIFKNRYYDNLPGREWTAKKQCEFLLREKNATAVTLNDICLSLQCETFRKTNSYFMGPALAGTHCAFGKECRRGECVPIIEPPYIFKYCEDDNWSEWKEDSCKSSCLEKSKGVLAKRRFCEHQNQRTSNCVGPYYDVTLCDDSLLCSKKRTIGEYTTIKCTAFSHIMSDLEKEPGIQAPHEVDKPWVACTIHCARKNFSTFYNPRIEMLNNGINPYFPDGTWCHREKGHDFYCRQHHCRSQNYSFEEQWTMNFSHIF